MLNYKCRIIGLAGATNIRDLGGYAGADGKMTAFGKFIRAASLSDLTESDCDTLRDLGVDCVLDLRSRIEAQKMPDVNIGEGVAYKHVPLLDYIQSTVAEDGAEGWAFPDSLIELYTGVLEKSKADMKTIFETFAADYNTILFHCTAGKDRTGITSMLLLGLTGVDDDVIIEDYSYSQHLLEMEYQPGVPQFLFESSPETMRRTIDYIKANYGSVEQYLATCGISTATMGTIKEKFTR